METLGRQYPAKASISEFPGYLDLITMDSFTVNQSALPITDSKDVLVVGGSFAGMAAALTLARAGYKVILVEPRTYLGREITATLRPWIRVPLDEPKLPELVASIVATGSLSSTPGEYILHLDAIKIRLEDILLEAGVKIQYASLPIGVCVEKNRLSGVIIGNKSGRQVILCQVLVDATETALAARLTGATFEDHSKRPFCFSQTLLFNVNTTPEMSNLPVPSHLGLVKNQLRLHRSQSEPGQVLVEYEFERPLFADTAIERTRGDIFDRSKSWEVAKYLVTQAPSFHKAVLGTISYETHGSFVTRMSTPVPEWAEKYQGVQVSPEAGGRFSLAGFAGPVAGLWCLSQAARINSPFWEQICEPTFTHQMGTAFAQALLKVGDFKAVSERILAPERVPANEPSPQLKVNELYGPQRGWGYKRIGVDPVPIPVAGEVDVLVVGGGSSGAVAALSAAGAGVSTFLVEMNPGLGGTGTYGGVSSYWCGRRVGFVTQVSKAVNRAQRQLRLPALTGYINRWNIEAKTQALIQEAEESGVGLLFNAIVIGAIMEGNTVRGVIIATRLGPLALLAHVTIDATGDGDIAAFAGARFTYGSRRDHAVMWYSLIPFVKPGVTRNNFTSMVDISNIDDYNRAILAARRRGDIASDHDHGIYVATRESRHIQGEVVLTLNDQLLHRSWPDVIYVAFSNNDIKGQISSDWFRIGLIPPHLEIEIPYGALLPQGLENILVVGKAVSATHDALPSIRMQPDLENLGGVAGMVAARAIREKCSPRQINIKALQGELVRVGVLPEEILTRTLVSLKFSETELKSMVHQLSADKPLHAYSDMRLYHVFKDRIPIVDICSAGQQVIPIMERELEQAQGQRKVLLAQALAMIGSQAGVPALIEAIEGQLSGKELPRRKHKVRQADRFAPDQAAMPEAAHLLYSLGMTRDLRALPIWQRVADLLAGAAEEDVWSQSKGVFHYVDAVCVGAEQLGSPSAAPILKQIHGYPVFQGQRTLTGFQADYLKERLAYLEVVIGRALARCGSPDGIIILVDYLEDVRALLTEQAYSELVAITRQDFGRNAAAWSHWLEMEGECMRPTPWTEASDPVQSWGEKVLITQQLPVNPNNSKNPS